MLVIAYGNSKSARLGYNTSHYMCWDRADKLFTYTRNSLKMLRSVWLCGRWGSVIYARQRGNLPLKLAAVQFALIHAYIFILRLYYSTKRKTEKGRREKEKEGGG